MFELLVGVLLTTSIQLTDSMNDRVVYIKADQIKIMVIEDE